MTSLGRELVKDEMYTFNYRYGLSLYKDDVAFKLVMKGKDAHTYISGRPENFILMRSTATDIKMFRRKWDGHVEHTRHVQRLRRWQTDAHQYFSKEVQQDKLMKGSEENIDQILEALDRFLTIADLMKEHDKTVSDKVQKQISDCRSDMALFYNLACSQSPSRHAESASVWRSTCA